MKTINLTKLTEKYKSGWIAVNKKAKVITKAKNFESLSNKVNGKKNIYLLPITSKWFGYIT
jgi:hypothetical protein